MHVALATLSWRLPVLSPLMQSGMVNSTNSQSSRLSTVRLTTTDVIAQQNGGWLTNSYYYFLTYDVIEFINYLFKGIEQVCTAGSCLNY